MATEHVLETHVSSHAEKQAAEVICGAFDVIRDATREVEDAQVNALYQRYKWGRQVYDAVQPNDVSASDVYAEVAKRLDKSESYVNHHKRFAERCAEAYPGFDPPVAGYVAEAHDKDWRLTWRRAVRWISSSNEESGTEQDPDEEIDRLIKDVEHHREKLDETLTELEERASEGEVPERLEKTAESVTVAAKEDVEDTVGRLARLPDAAPERIEDPTYTEWVAREHACCACGVEGETIVPHHLREYIAETGMSTKPDDYDVVPICSDCHDTLEDMPSLEFWRTRTTKPMKVARALNSKFLRLIRTDQL